jgi:ubiquinone/menaquinone biosynthesis C-methylase UbiE
MKKSIDNVGFPGNGPEKKELAEDSQERMWEQLSELKSKLEKENLQIEDGWKFSEGLADIRAGQVKKIMEGKDRSAAGSQGLRETANWYEMDEGGFLKILENKRTLDIGSSMSTLAKQAKARAQCDIVSLDPNESVLKDKEMAVAAEGEALPFNKESFDEVFATFSLPYRATNEKQVEDFFQESLRVTKVGGHIHIVPITTIQNKYFDTSFDDSNIYVANKIQIKTIEVLQIFKESGEVEMLLEKNYKAAGKKNEERIKAIPPTLVTITKLK